MMLHKPDELPLTEEPSRKCTRCEFVGKASDFPTAKDWCRGCLKEHFKAIRNKSSRRVERLKQEKIIGDQRKGA